MLAWAVPSYATVIVQLKVLEGDAAVYRTGSRATRGLTVLVTDENGKPVPNASVSFQLPAQGATGTFGSGLRTEVVSTGADGKATVWGMQWGKTAGSVEIRITAVKDQARAGLISTQILSESAPAKEGKDSGEGTFSQPHSGHAKWFLLAAALAGGAAAGVLLTMSHSAAPTPAAQASALSCGPATNGVTICTPSIYIGHP